MGIILSKKKKREVAAPQQQANEHPPLNQFSHETVREEPEGSDHSETQPHKDSEKNQRSNSEHEESSDEEKDDKHNNDDSQSKHSSSSNSTSKRSNSTHEDEEKQKEEEEEEEEEEERDRDDEEDLTKDEAVMDHVIDTLSYEEKVKKALIGDLDFAFPEKVKVVRIFTSSTFTDTSVERNTLMERVYPRLKSFCQERGYDFQVVDMRWGVRDESTDDHMTTELCMKELRACQKLSTGPNFITFLGQKYGYRPFPAKIDATEFEKLLSAVDNHDDVQLLKRWFWRDDNAVPAQYLLQPITSLLPHYRDYENNELRKEASSEWWSAFERMQVVFRKAADKTLKNRNELHKYYMSVTEDEIRRGVINATEKDKHCFWFKRVITDLSEKSGDGNAGKFIDKTWGDPSGVDESAQQLLNQLREKDLPEALTDNNVIQYDVTWHSNGIDPSASQEHASYIEKLCTDFYTILTERINRGINDNKTVNTEDPLTDEIFQHGSFCKRKNELFHGREEFLNLVQNVLKENRVAVLYGESGCGKTSLMAKIATEVKKWLDKKSATLVLRFIGTTPDSSDVRSLMRSVCQQLIRGHPAEDGENEEDAETVPQDIRSLVEFFPKCLEKYATASKPVVLVLDSLDQLSDDDAGRELDWLPRKLPKSVYIALSTLPGEQYICLPKLQEKFGDSVLLEVPKMPVDTAKQILDSWLKSSKRILQGEQEKIVLDAFQKCPLPLYLKLSFDEASRWKSFSQTDDTRLAPSIKGIINDLFDRVERLHGKQLVSQALAYITASKNGLTEPELEDILSLDDIVLNDVYQYWTPPIRRLPPLLWIRIRSDIGDYLIERGADDSRVIYWYHRQFVEVARARYLKPERVESIHLNMSEYFLGKWSNGVKKSFMDKKGTEMSMDRLVSKQPLLFDPNAEKSIFNLRKLSELPHHLLHSNQLEKLKEDTLCNFEFLLAKVQAMSVDAVLQDFNASLALYPDDQELGLLSKCINLAAHPLRTDPRQLSAQLLGRMHKYLKRDGNSNLKRVLLGAQYPSVPAFIPNQQCLTPPGGALVHALANDEFHGGIEFVCFTNDSKTVVTCNRGSEGLCLLFIDIKSGRRQRKVCFDESSTSVNSCWRARISTRNNDIFLAAGSDNNVYLINAKTNKILMEYAPMKDQKNWFRRFPTVEFADNDNLVVALGDAGLRVWETESGKLLHDLPIKGIDVDNQFGYFDAQGDLAAYCLFEKKTVHVVNVKTGKEICKINVDLKKEEIQGELKDTKVKEIHLTATKQLLVASEAYIKQELKVYYAATGKHVLDIPDFGMGHDHRLAVTEDGRVAISIRNNYEMVKWDLDTGKAIVAARIQPQFGIYTRKGDFVATASSDGVLGIWDARGTVDDEETEVSATTQGFPDSIWMMVVAADKRHVIASCTVKMMPEIAVWDALTSVKVRSIKAMNFPQPLRMLNDKIGVGRIAVGIPTEKSFDHYKVLDFDSAKAVKVLQGKASKRIEAIGLVGQNHLIGLSRGRRNLKMWDIHTGKVVAQYKLGQKYRIEAFLISEDGGTVVCSQASFHVQQDESTVPLLAFNTKTHEHKELEAVLDEQLTLEYAAITHDGKYLLVQLTNHFQSAIWDTQDGRIHRLLGEGSCGRGMVAISSKSMLALTGNTDGNRLMVWKVDSGELLYDFSSAEIDKIYLLQNGTIAVTSDSKAYEPTCLEAWDLMKSKKLTTFTVEINPSTLSPLAGQHIAFVAPASVKVMTFRLHIPGYDEEKLGTSSYGAHKELSEFQGMTGPCDLNDNDEDKDDDDSEIMS